MQLTSQQCGPTPGNFLPANLPHQPSGHHQRQQVQSNSHPQRRFVFAGAFTCCVPGDRASRQGEWSGLLNTVAVLVTDYRDPGAGEMLLRVLSGRQCTGRSWAECVEPPELTRDWIPTTR